MKKSTWVLRGILGITLVFGMTAVGCSSTTGSVQKASWSNYTSVPSKDYTVVGIVVVRGDDIKTLSADLMAKAAEIGADDIINVRIDLETDNNGKRKITAGTAVAVKYAETLTSTSTVTTTSTSANSTDKTSVTDTNPIMDSNRISSSNSSGSGGGKADENVTGKKKGLFGLGFLFL